MALDEFDRVGGISDRTERNVDFTVFIRSVLIQVQSVQDPIPASSSRKGSSSSSEMLEVMIPSISFCFFA